MSWLAYHEELLELTNSAIRPEELGWEESVRDLLVSYCVHYDAANIEGILNVFADDATYTSSLGSFTGETKIRTNYEQLLAKYKRTMHFITNVTLRLDSSISVRAASYMQAFVTLNDGFGYTLGGLYHDRIEKRDGQWKIAERTVVDGVAFRLDLMETQARLTHL